MENQHAPDYFNITVDGAPLLFGAFAHRVLPIGPLGQTLPTANLVAWGRLGFEEQGRAANHDAIYDYRGSFALSSLPHTASSVTITCFASGAGWQGWNDPDRRQDEAFGVDHITVTTNSPNLPPACTDAAASPNALWPANHEMVAIAIGVVTDPDGDPIHITVNSVFQDESANVTDYGDTAPDAPLNPLYVRAERAKTGNARAYHINFTAADDNGGTCTGSVMVGVPHDKGKQNAVVDGGSLLDSTRLQVQTDIISPNMTGESQGLGRALLPRVSGCRIVRRRLRPVAREGERVAERRACHAPRLAGHRATCRYQAGNPA